MLPVDGAAIAPNVRHPFSQLDFALLQDIGYNVSASPQGTNIGGTYTDPNPQLGGSCCLPVRQAYPDWLLSAMTYSLSLIKLT